MPGEAIQLRRLPALDCRAALREARNDEIGPIPCNCPIGLPVLSFK